MRIATTVGCVIPVQPFRQSSQSAHVVVLGNWKGGSGKATAALHIAVALLRAGQRVATIDLGEVEHRHDAVIIDTPGNDVPLMRLGLSMADIPITPLNDSVVDVDVLATLDPASFAVTGESHDAEMVREARRRHGLVDGRMTDRIVVRNRLPAIGSHDG